MDADIRKHFEKWLDSAVQLDLQDQIRTLMLDQYRLDPEFWNEVGWPALYMTIFDKIVFE